MAPTHDQEEIEGRYKEYAYSPVPPSSSSAVYDSTTLGKYPVEIGVGSSKYRTNGVHDKCRVANMAEKGSTLPQYVAAAAANLCCVASGALLGWTSPVLPNLGSTLEDNPLGRKITADENSWIGSLISVGAIIGSFVAGYLAERWGRKMTLLSSVVPFLIGWVLIATAGVVYQLFVARIILGFALAFAFTVVPMYCGEIAETSVRGALGSFLQLFVTIGLLYAYAIGPFVSYVAFAIICAIPPVVFFACFFMMPESPYHLLKIGKREEAVQALAKLRKKSPASVQKEADEIQAAIDDAFRNEAKISDLFKVKANLKALIFTCLLVAFQQCSGINVVLFYMGSIFQAAHSALPDSISTIIVGAVQTATSGITPLICDKLGRRMLLITSGIGEIVSLIALGLYMFLQDVEKSDVSGISWLPIVSLVIFIALYCIGWGPLPWTVMGEMFASNVKSKASGITVSVCWLVSFFITKFASDLQQVFGQYLLYWLFAVFCVLSVLFTFFILPETKGKSLQQIQNELSGEHPEIPEFGDSSKQ
ncbi:solute carrier family 2, facilitated glucose transporter member 8-like [Frieseomelitta varia]|uniref:solute carrier family 2, facilitated glucose transporter member 8-like n=1 Tax=Frieseomelitta varia TaxID=561572 RepID=UPI001CB68754|nr:solute carrier family 2, facilitated glucose transporter member 8-like [Frieseomelitta varia]